MVLLTLVVACRSAGPSSPKSLPATPEAGSSPEAGLPANVGYLRSSHPFGSRFTVFNADTFEVYRAVDLPPASIDFSHRLEFGPAGRIWLGYHHQAPDEITKTLINGKLHIDKIRDDQGVLVFSPGR